MLRGVLNQLAIVLVFLGVSTQVQAQDDSPEAFMVSISDQVLAEVRENGASYDSNPEILQSALLQLLDPIVDFQSFSRGVMGSYYADATPAQRSAFIDAFKATLVDLYTTALVGAEIDTIDISETITRSPGIATVEMRASSSVNGGSYMIQYSMRKNDAGEWKVRNIIIDGINIGLTYRSQFKSAMETENEDIGQVITKWPQIIDGQ
jgi:phospholipid transport system substrate-binding protein